MSVRANVLPQSFCSNPQARSRASQISLNIAALEGWTTSMALPNGVGSHFAPVRELISWLRVSVISLSVQTTPSHISQNLSSIADFADLIATTQSLRSLNPLQVRFGLLILPETI